MSEALKGSKEEQILFESKEEGIERGIKIISKSYIGNGNMSTVYRIQGLVQGDNGKERLHTFVLKDYNTRFPYKTEQDRIKVAQGHAGSAVAVHALLRKHKLPTWTTCRPDVTGTRLIMSDGELDEHDHIVTHNNPSVSRSRIMHTISAITNLEATMTQALEAARAAAKAGITVRADAWMERFRVTDATTELSLLIGDLEMVRGTEPYENMVANNIHELGLTLRATVTMAMKPEEVSDALARIDAIFPTS